MAFQYKSISFTNINRDGTALSPTLSFTPGTTPAVVDRFAIGNRVRMVVTVEITGASTWTNKAVRMNIMQFGRNVNEGPDFGLNSNGFVSVTATPGIWVTGNDGVELTRQNLDSISFQLVSGTDLEITMDLFITTDLGQYINPASFFVNNQLRLLTSRFQNFTNILESVGQTIFSTLEFFGITIRIKPNGAPDELVTNPTTLANFWNIPWVARWYNSGTPTNSGSGYSVDTVQQRWMNQLAITCPSQVSSGLASLANWGAPTWMATPSTFTDSMFTFQSIPPVALGSFLALNEKNTVTVRLEGYSDSSLTVTAINNIRVLLIRTDDFANNNVFVGTYDLSEGIIPAASIGNVQIHEALWGPNSWVQNLGSGRIDLTFTIDGAFLQLGREYRIIVNVYETANPDRPTAHISPPLYVQYVPPALPTIDSFLGTYAQEYNVTELDEIAPHQRIRARLDIDKASYAAALAAFGFTGTFDGSLDQITATFVGVSGIVSDTIETYRPNTLPSPLSNLILSNGMQIVTDDAATLSPAATFRVEAERASTTATIRWVVRMRQPNYTPGSYQVYDITFDQTVDIREFENTAGIPVLVGIRFLNPDVYPGVKEDILDICDRDFIICEVEKDGALLTGSVNLIATIYPVNSSGATTNPQIEEEESWAPSSVVIPIAISGKLDSVDASFGGDDFAVFKINTQQLNLGQRYRVTAIAIEQVPDYCPIGLVALTSITTQNTGGPSNWFTKCDISAWVAEIVAHPDYVGGLSIIYNQIEDGMGITVGTPSLAGYILTTSNIPTSYTEVYYTVRIDAIFDPGTGPHTISHVLFFTVPRPVFGAPSVAYNTNSYTCSDLG